MQQVEILLPNAVNHGFDYMAGETALEPGAIVSVPFGRAGESLGVVWGQGKAELKKGKIKQVKQFYAQFPPLSETLRRFISWAAWYNCAPLGMVLKMVLPMDDIAKEGRAHIETAIDCSKLSLAPLSSTQQSAADAMKTRLGAGFSVTLLDGVTGSGKTEVYFDVIAALLREDVGGTKLPSSYKSSLANNDASQILVLLPEIALSVQWLERFAARFGFTPVVWNSEITHAKKRAAWQAIVKGEARVVVGARSALFLPYKNLKLIVVDEEHDASFKQEEGVIYHARDMAVARARFEAFPIILVSATPSLESYYNAMQGKYHEVSLPARHGAAQLPDVEMLDMRHVPLERGAFISGPLRQALAQAVASRHQAMLFLNRRGYAPLVLCRACGHRFQCPNCTSWMVLHKNGNFLQCHHCAHRTATPKHCPECNAENSLHACGPGVERIHEEVAAFLPQARVTVMASDTMHSYKELSQAIHDMEQGRTDILIGTQMVAKGHHFADLAVVGVVDADLGLSGGDLRASERTYQLLHQLSGRAGRERIHGKVYLQSFLPSHPVMQALISGERANFLAAELEARRVSDMPPFSRLAALIIEGAKEEPVMQMARQLAASAPPTQGIDLWGPAPAPLAMLRGKFRYRLLIRARRSINLPNYMRSWVEAQTASSNLRIRIDIDPVSFL